MTRPHRCLYFRLRGVLGTAFLQGALALSATLIVSPHTTSTARAMLQDSPKAVLDEAWQIVNRDYVDPKFNQVDWQQIRHSLLSRSYKNRQEAYTALRDALKTLNDPYTRFLDPNEFQALNNETDGELTGVGMQLELNEQTQTLTVVKPLENSPAMRSGVQAGDVILQIDGHPAKGMSVETASNLLRGQVNTPVRLLLQHTGGTPFELNLTRQRLEIPTVHSALRLQARRRIGYIRLSEFSGHAGDQMRQAIADLKRQKVDEFVLDLRGNPGGRLDQDIEIARMWLNNGTIVRTVDRNQVSEDIRADRTALTNLPVAVLVDGDSASASEILTGALKDNHRAVVIGTQTFGKALVQSVNPLSDGSGINVTVAHYFTPAGLDINHQGITPDISVNLTDQQRQYLAAHPDHLGTPLDPQYERAVTHLVTVQGMSPKSE